LAQKLSKGINYGEEPVDLRRACICAGG